MTSALASKYVFLADQRPRFARRFPPVNETDSGWCLLSGHRGEDEPDFEDQPTNFRRNTLAELTDLFPELAAIFDAPVDSMFEWDEAASYRVV
ncbi:MAG: DUF2185 domain-containing protein [Deltaproteobacteria bacterium]|nr:DUF2185 domain-containing protein [Deltaproteobacteria bacterium]